MTPKLPTSRREAIATGATHYQTGLPCHRWHYAPRRTRDGACMECARLRQRTKRSADKFRFRESSEASPSMALIGKKIKK